MSKRTDMAVEAVELDYKYDEKIEKDIEFLDAQIKATRNKESKTLGELVLIRKKIEDKELKHSKKSLR